MSSTEVGAVFGPEDDYLHPPSDSFYENETFWFSFFVPERGIGGWIYTAVKQNVGVCQGGMWIWDDSATAPWDVPYFQQFGTLKPPTFDGPVMSCPTGATIEILEPGMEYDLQFDDRERVQARFRFRGLERPVPLLRGEPPFTTASHYDQAGHVTGHFVLDGERTEVDCYAVRDRSWGPRSERGFRSFGYTWLADPDTTLVAFSSPADGADDVYAGYRREGATVARLVAGTRTVTRGVATGFLETVDFDVRDEQGRRLTARGRVLSRMILPGSTSVCINSVIEFDLDGRTVYGEDQDVWSMDTFRAYRAAGRRRA